jgi:flagellar motor protein MotB
MDAEPGNAVERHLATEEPFMQWALDRDLLERESGDRLEQREVLAERPETVKLTRVIPPIRFESGVAQIPPSYVERLRGILDGMRHLDNVRLHLVGHADAEPLSENLAGIYGDNRGLSRERAGEVAEFVQAALELPPEAISFEWVGDTRPIATNETEAGRALNRRVEVEVWYDRPTMRSAVEEVVIPQEFKRVKVCRIQTVCKLRYRDGFQRRARVKNLIPPLGMDEETVGFPEAFTRQIREALHNLRDRQNVTIKFIGFTDAAPLAGREERIYGTHLALSKANAHRVAMAVREALDLPSAAVTSDGRGARSPVASNASARARALNRRVEVEFWHDDPLQELPDELQPCPDAAEAELVTRVYDPPWGSIEPLQIEGGEAVVPAGYAEALRRAMAEVAEEENVRLRFVGYVGNERLERRTALVYGDDVGLSAARARHTRETIAAELGLTSSQAEHEGRGYVHSNDVVNAGFLAGDASYVAVEVVYDELVLPDDYEGVDITPITRELRPKHPLELNLMRITVDGEPIDDLGRSSADVQRCTDVALDRADIRFRFDDLETGPRLSVTADPVSVPLDPAVPPETQAAVVHFQAYSNYSHFIDRSEVRIFRVDQSPRGEPLAVVEVGPGGLAPWSPDLGRLPAAVYPLKYVLRAYGPEGQFDETVAKPLWLVRERGMDVQPVRAPSPDPGQADEAARAEMASTGSPGREPALTDASRAGYGESELGIRNIPLGDVGSVRVQGSGVPPDHTVWLAGESIPVDPNGAFEAEAILPSGLHTVEVAVLDEEGNGELFLRDLELERNDWFYVGMADVTLAANRSSGPAGRLTGDDAPYDLDSPADGRLAFYTQGRFGEEWKLTASADTREGPIEELFSNFMDKSPEDLFRRIDPDYHYPTLGDDGSVDELAPTAGKFFVRLRKRNSQALWGNFKVSYLNNELAHVDRGLYGANLHYESDATTSFGEDRLVLDSFAAEPGTVPSREEFRGTGGSLYFLRRQDLLAGSERVRIEIRDKDSGLVSGVVHLSPVSDYDVDYLQGRILLSEPLAPTADDRTLVRSGGSNGDEAWLIVQYEFTPGFDEVDALATGGQGQYWLNDSIKLGLTANRNEEGEPHGARDSSRPRSAPVTPGSASREPSYQASR